MTTTTPEERMLMVEFVDGARVAFWVRLLSVAFAQTAPAREPYSCFGVHSGIGAEAELAAAYRDFPEDRLIAETKLIPFERVRFFAMGPGERLTFLDWFGATGTEALIVARRPTIDRLLSGQDQASWERASFRVLGGPSG